MGLGPDWAIEWHLLQALWLLPLGALQQSMPCWSCNHNSASRPAGSRSVEIDTFSWALRLNNEVAPLTVESAQYSVPFCVAMALARGADALVQIEQDDISRAETIALAGRIRLGIDPAFDAMFPQAVPTRVRIKTSDGVVSTEVAVPLGEPANPMDWSALENKFRAVADRRLDARCRDRFLTAFEDLKQGEAGETAVRARNATGARIAARAGGIGYGRATQLASCRSLV